MFGLLKTMVLLKPPFDKVTHNPAVSVKFKQNMTEHKSIAQVQWSVMYIYMLKIAEAVLQGTHAM